MVTNRHELANRIRDGSLKKFYLKGDAKATELLRFQLVIQIPGTKTQNAQSYWAVYLPSKFLAGKAEVAAKLVETSSNALEISDEPFAVQT